MEIIAYSPTMCGVGLHEMVDDPILFSAVILNEYINPATRPLTLTEVASRPLIVTGSMTVEVPST